MNRTMLSKMKLWRVKVRPLARRFDENGSELEELDDIWIIQEVSRDRMTLFNSRSQHLVPIGTDHIREYLTDGTEKTDGFLRLKSQILLQHRDMSVEPLDDRGGLLRSSAKGTNVSADDLDDALRLAKGIVIEGLSPIFEMHMANYVGINVSAFTAYVQEHRKAVNYNSGSISGLAPNTTYYVYALDPSRQGGAVPYVATPVRYKALSGDEKVYIGRLRTQSRETRK